MPHLTLYDHVYCPRGMMESHARHRLFICAVQEGWRHAMPDVFWPCVLTKGDDGMPRLTSSIYVCSPRAMIPWHAWRWSTVLFKFNDHMPHLTSSNRVHCQSFMMACQDRCPPTVCTFQWQLWDATPNIVRLCVQSKGYKVFPHMTLSDFLSCPRVKMAYRARCFLTVFVVEGH